MIENVTTVDLFELTSKEESYKIKPVKLFLIIRDLFFSTLKLIQWKKITRKRATACRSIVVQLPGEENLERSIERIKRKSYID